MIFVEKKLEIFLGEKPRDNLREKISDIVEEKLVKFEGETPSDI